jgi:hypothetical protein
MNIRPFLVGHALLVPLGCGGELRSEGTADAGSLADSRGATTIFDAASRDVGLLDASLADVSSNLDASVADASSGFDVSVTDASSENVEQGTCTSDPCTLYTGTGNGFPTGIAVDSSRVYVVENMAGLVLAMPLGGGTAVTLASDSRPDRVAVNGAAVYWTSQVGGVKSVGLGGGAVTTIAPASGTTEGIRLDATNVYWTLVGQAGSVLSAPLGGGPTRTIASAQDDPLYLAVTSSVAYWINGDIYQGPDDGCVMTVPLGGGTPTAVTPFDNLGGLAITVDSANVYWAESGAIYSWPLVGGTVTTLVSNVSPTDIAVDSSHVYWTDRNANAVMKVPIAGGATVMVATSFELPMYLAVDATSVYWTDFADLVMKAAK